MVILPELIIILGRRLTRNLMKIINWRGALVLSKKNKKERLGKRLWNSITEPIPDDDNDEQDSEQIPLAYDLKDSATSKADDSEESANDSEAKSTVNIPRSTATTDSAKQPVDAVIEPAKVAQKATGKAKSNLSGTRSAARVATEDAASAAEMTAKQAQSEAQTSPTKTERVASKKGPAATDKSAADKAKTSAVSQASAATSVTASRMNKHASQAASATTSATEPATTRTSNDRAAASTTAAEEVPMTRTARHARKQAASQTDQAKSQATAAATPHSNESQSKAPQSESASATTKSQASKSQAPTAASAPAKSAAARSAGNQTTAPESEAPQQRVARRIPADHIPPVARKQQPRIAVKGTEDSVDEAQPELPLSREELYGDQQPNGGKQPNKTAMSRVARHGEQTPNNDHATDDDRDFSQLEADVKNPHLKKQPRRYNWKLMLTGVVILVVAAGGALFMWKHAQTTQAEARTNAEKIVDQVYTSSAQRDLRASASSATLTKLQHNIDDMKDSSEKTSLQKQHDVAAKMLTVRTDYQDLRNAKGLIQADVTMDTITKNQQRLTTTGLTNSKPYFAKKYDKQFETTGKTVKKVAGYDAAFKKLYNKKNKLKASTPSVTVDKVLANLKTYRKRSQLADNDYRKLVADRKKLSQANQSSSSAASSSTYSYSEPESSSSSSSSVYSASSAESSSTTNDYSYSNDTDTSSATTSSSTPSYSATSESSSTTDYGTGTSSTTTGNNGTGTGTSTYSATSTN